MDIMAVMRAWMTQIQTTISAVRKDGGLLMSLARFGVLGVARGK